MSQQHDNIQKQIRQHIKVLLKRSPASISREDYERLFHEVKKKDRLRLHFFIENGNRLEWKLNVTAKELETLSSPRLSDILSAFATSHAAKNRTQFPFLAPANKEQMIHDYSHIDGHTYGFDILIRRPTSSIEQEGERSLYIGDLSFGFIIHVELTEDGVPADDPKYLMRAAWGESLKMCRLWENLRDPLDAIEPDVLRFLRSRDYVALTKCCVTTANDAARYSFPI